MFSPVSSVIGTVLVLVAVIDFYITTVTLKSAGPLATAFSRCSWALLRGIHRKLGVEWLMSAAGPVILLLLIMMWFGMCWVGWFLIFCGHEPTIVNATTSVPATLIERFYYAGYTLTTIGYGDFKATGGLGQVFSVIAGLNGLFLVTLAITYSMPVVSAAADRRQLAVLIYTLGESTAEIVDKNHQGGSYEYLAMQLQQLSTKVTSVSQQHLAYPVIHYFYDGQEYHALPPNLVRLQEALSVIAYAFPKLPQSTRLQLEATQKVIQLFLSNLYRRQAEGCEIPQPPDCRRVKVLAHSDRTPDEIQDYLSRLESRRLLAAYVKGDGRSWEMVHRDR